jgi:hypothetical protein
MGRVARELAAALLLAAGCEAEIPACPGSVQGTMTLTGAASAPLTTCTFAVPASFELTAAVSFVDGSTAAVCIQRPLVVNRNGPRDPLDPDHFTVQYTLPVVTLSTCPCPVDLRETLDGKLLRTASSASVGFAGTLVDHFTRTSAEPAPTCYASADPATVASGCPGAPDGSATPPTDGGCDAGYLVTAPTGP